MGNVGSDDASGIPMLVFGALWISLGALCIKLVGPSIPLMELVLARASIGVVLSYLLLRNERVSPWGNRRGLLTVRGLIGFAAMTCGFYALIHLPLADATLYFFMHPVFAALLAVPLLGERVGLGAMLGISLSLAGLTLVAKPEFLFSAGAPQDGFAVLVALSGALLAGITIIIVRKLGQSEHAMVVVFYQVLAMIPVSLAFSLHQWVWPTFSQWLLLAAIGVTFNAGQYFLVMGFSREPAGKASAVGYLQVIFAAIWGAVLFQEYPDGFGVLGSLLIIGGSLAVTQLPRRP